MKDTTIYWPNRSD